LIYFRLFSGYTLCSRN